MNLAVTAIYLTPDTPELRQGEILTGLIHSAMTPESLREYLATGGSANAQISLVSIGYALVLTQDCDLEQDFHTRQSPESPDKLLQHILLCEAGPAERFNEDPALRSREIRKHFANNKLERYQYLGPVDAGIDSERTGLPALGLDFKRYLTIPTELVYLQLERGPARRRAKLAVPFAEHLSDRFFAYHARIALPVQHYVKDPTAPETR